MIEHATRLLMETEGGTHTARLGPYALHTAFQPIYSVNARSGTLIGVEALARPVLRGASIDPLDFFARVPAARQLWADWLCLILHVNNAAAWQLSDLSVFLNMHPDAAREPRQLCRNLEALADHAARLGIAPSRIVFEITERRAGSPDGLETILAHVRALGCRIAVDDFGAPGSSLVRVVELEPEFVKIDPAWLAAMLAHESSASLPERVINRLDRMGTLVICEGVETPRQLNWARTHGARLIQGHLFGAAIPVNASPSEARLKPAAGDETRGSTSRRAGSGR